MSFFGITHMVVIVPNRNKIVLINKNYFIMITKSQNETHYELVASAANGKFRFLNRKTAIEMHEELYDDANYYANEGIARVMAKLRLARFAYYTSGEVMSKPEYNDALDYILNEELKYKYPRYEEFAMGCAYSIAEHDNDEEFIRSVEKFYEKRATLRRRK